MATYVKPQVLVFQDFTLVPSEITTPLRAHISGPNQDLHRYSVAAEKSTIDVGDYDSTAASTYLWPGRSPGGIVDMAAVNVYADDALLMYLNHQIGDSQGAVTAVSGQPNWIQSSKLSFKANGTAYDRSAIFGDRDVQLGDAVYLRSISNDGHCTVTELSTYVTGFASSSVASAVELAESDVGNEPTVTASISIEKTGGPVNCVTATVTSPSLYNGLETGDVSEVYTINVIQSSIAGCNAARLQVISASGNDDVAEVTPSAFGTSTAIGTRGVHVTFHDTPAGGCSASASLAAVEPNELVIGQQYKVSVTMAFAEVLAESGGSYTGANNDTYVIECTQGGDWATFPQITVKTVKGLDFSGPTEVTGANVAVPIGSQGVTVLFYGLANLVGSSASLDFDQPVPALRAGDKWYIPVTGVAAGPVTRLILKDDLPTTMLTATDIELQLYIQTSGLQVSPERAGFAPLLNWTTTPTQITINSGIQLYYPSWTVGGVAEPLPLVAGTLYVEFAEFLQTLVGQIGEMNDVADIDSIPGPLDPGNVLKWGVYSALQNSGGTNVLYTAVSNPAVLDSWVAVLSTILGNDNLYNLVPLTFDVDVKNLYAAQIAAESSDTSTNWKAGFFALQAVTSQAIVSQTSSSDSEVAVATVADNPQAVGTQYTLLQSPNGQFITNGVVPGDIVRYLFTVDGFGNTEYAEYVVDTVISQNSLLLTTALDSAITRAEKIEIWHTLTQDQVVTNLVDQAGAFASNRICAVWPDSIGDAGTNYAGYFLCASLAGLASGIAPQQALTQVAIAGYDSVPRTTAFFNGAQLDTLAAAGVLIVTQNAAGTVYTRDGVTTAGDASLNTFKEMRRRNLDSMAYYFLNSLAPYIGVCNVTPSMLNVLKYQLQTAINFLTTANYTDQLGGQLISGTISVLQISPLLPDRIEVVLDLNEPYSLDNLELHLVV